MANKWGCYLISQAVAESAAERARTVDVTKSRREWGRPSAVGPEGVVAWEETAATAATTRMERSASTTMTTTPTNPIMTSHLLSYPPPTRPKSWTRSENRGPVAMDDDNDEGRHHSDEEVEGVGERSPSSDHRRSHHQHHDHHHQHQTAEEGGASPMPEHPDENVASVAAPATAVHGECTCTYDEITHNQPDL